MRVSDILQQAAARLTPATWGQGTHALMLGKRCAGIAINTAGLYDENAPRAYSLFTRVATGRPSSNIGPWNDAPGRTLEEVQDAFAAAIVIAQQQEAEQAQEGAPAAPEAAQETVSC